MEQDHGASASGPGCQPSASAGKEPSSQSGIANAGEITPGPWDWETSRTFSANGGFHLYLIDSRGRKIAALWGKEKEKAANARAISALPDLLASLEWIAGHDAAANGLTGFAAEMVDSFTGEARRALASAIGEQA